MQCNDCSSPVGKRDRSRRDDVCDSCFDRRLAIVRGNISATQSEIQTIQSAMLEGKGQARLAIDTVLGREHGDFSI